MINIIENLQKCELDQNPMQGIEIIISFTNMKL